MLSCWIRPSTHYWWRSVAVSAWCPAMEKAAEHQRKEVSGIRGRGNRKLKGYMAVCSICWRKQWRNLIRFRWESGFCFHGGCNQGQLDALQPPGGPPAHAWHAELVEQMTSLWPDLCLAGYMLSPAPPVSVPCVPRSEFFNLWQQVYLSWCAGSAARSEL